MLKRQFKGVPILGLTATASDFIIDDVKQMLGIPSALVFRLVSCNCANDNDSTFYVCYIARSDLSILSVQKLL